MKQKHLERSGLFQSCGILDVFQEVRFNLSKNSELDRKYPVFALKKNKCAVASENFKGNSQ